MDKIEKKQIEENKIEFDEGSRISFIEDGDAMQVKVNDESRISFLESSESELPTNFFNTQLRSEDDEGKSTYEEVFDFESDNSVQDPDFDPSLSDEAGNSTGIEEDVVLNEAPTTSQRAYSLKISYERRNQGKTYVNVKGNVVSERKLRPLVHDCRMKCKGKVLRTLQESIFGKYWSLGTYNQRILFMESLIDVNNKKTQNIQKHPEKPRERKFQADYHVEYEGQRVRICQKCFLQCFDESASFIKTVLKKKLNFPQNNLCDQRGSGGGKYKLKDDIIQLVKDHINSFPNYESHYSRRDTSCKYFHADLSLAQMYKLYCDKYKSEAISISSYAGVFKGMNDVGMNDVDHSVIERKKNRTDTQIHHPHDWYNFVRCVGSKHKFNVVEMNAEDFFNFSLLLKTKLMWRATNQDGEKFVWKNIRWLRYTKTNFGKIEYKTTLDIDAPFQLLNLLKRGVNSMNKDDLSMLNGDVKISSKKKNDLDFDLLPFINTYFHPFYKSLLLLLSLEIHPDLVEDEPETE